jgi:hypothetical protein
MSDVHKDRVQERAYQLWEEEGHPEGQHERHWRRAEDEFAEKSAVEDNRKAAGQIIESDTATTPADKPTIPPIIPNPD